MRATPLAGARSAQRTGTKLYDRTERVITQARSSGYGCEMPASEILHIENLKHLSLHLVPAGNPDYIILG